MLETSKVAAADHTGQLKKRQKAPERLSFNLLPLTGFQLAASLLQGKGDSTRQARPHRAGMQSQASMPRHGASTKTDSQRIVHCASFHSPPMHHPRASSLASHLHSPAGGGQTACWKLVSLLPATVGSCKLRWLHGLCSGPRETSVSSPRPNKGKHAQHTGTAQGIMSQILKGA